jgi:hypothetical protein
MTERPISIPHGRFLGYLFLGRCIPAPDSGGGRELLERVVGRIQRLGIDGSRQAPHPLYLEDEP